MMDIVGAVSVMFAHPSLSIAESAGSFIINFLLNARASENITILITMTDLTASGNKSLHNYI